LSSQQNLAKILGIWVKIGKSADIGLAKIPITGPVVKGWSVVRKHHLCQVIYMYFCSKSNQVFSARLGQKMTIDAEEKTDQL
jgi:hypothetical protein